MITQWLQNRRDRARQLADEVERLELVKKKEQLEELHKRGEELKKALVGIQRIPHTSINLKGDYTEMYCIIEGRLVKATMNRKGGLYMKYVGEEA